MKTKDITTVICIDGSKNVLGGKKQEHMECHDSISLFL